MVGGPVQEKMHSNKPRLIPQVPTNYHDNESPTQVVELVVQKQKIHEEYKSTWSTWQQRPPPICGQNNDPPSYSNGHPNSLLVCTLSVLRNNFLTT